MRIENYINVCGDAFIEMNESTLSRIKAAEENVKAMAEEANRKKAGIIQQAKTDSEKGLSETEKTMTQKKEDALREKKEEMKKFNENLSKKTEKKVQLLREMSKENFAKAEDFILEKLEEEIDENA